MATLGSPADVLKAAWAGDPVLNAIVPATKTADNRYFEEGLPPNLPESRLEREYVVLEDFGSTSSSTVSHPNGYINGFSWQFRVRIFSDQRKTAKDLAKQYKNAMKNMGAVLLSWDDGVLCKPRVTGERQDLSLTGNRYYEIVLSFQGTSQ